MANKITQIVDTLVMGRDCSAATGSLALGRDAIAGGVGACAIGLSHDVGMTCRAEGDGAFAVGLDAVVENTYGVAIGAHCLSRSAAAVAIGENCVAGVAGGGSGQNAVVIGFGSQATGTYSSAIGTQCYARGYGSHVHGISVSAEMCGEEAHGGGCNNGAQSSQGHRAVDMFRDINATSLALLMSNGTEIAFRQNSLNRVTVKVQATVIGAPFTGATKVACETIELLVMDVNTVNSVVGAPAWVVVGQSFASQGWTIGLSTITSGIRITVNSGADRVYAFARVEFSEIAGIS